MMSTTFLFTDIAGSTRLWQEHPEAMGVALATHDDMIGEAVTSRGGRVFKHTGDGVAAVFDDPEAAVEAASWIQQWMSATTHAAIGSLAVRIGIHTGEAEERDGDYFGLAVSRTARLMDAGHGGQVLVSFATRGLIDDADERLLDIGEYRLRDLTSPERIYQMRIDGQHTEFPRLRTLDAAPNNLPLVPTSFVGREQEQEELADLIRTSRLVTVSGVGGAGKTRLALQVAADIAPHFSDGVWLVELAPVTDPDAIDPALVGGLGLSQPSGITARQVILDHLAARSALLVVDNCEHLIDAAAELVDAIVATAPDVKVVATSRELLGVSGEVSYLLRSLGMPVKGDDDLAAVRSADAVRLFVERAAAARPGFTLTADNAGVVTNICRRLDGMPLAIELAAARLRSFSVDQIASHLDQRFRLLTGGARTALPRQQTLTAAIDWSYRLLSEAEKSLFLRLSVFSGGFTYEAAEAVCVGPPVDSLDILELLPALVDKSLVVAEEADGDVRYRLLETLRQYARDRLDEVGDPETWRRRHAEHYAGLAAPEIRRRMRGPEGPEVRQSIRVEMSNLRQGMNFALSVDDPELALALLYPFYRISLVDEHWSELLGWSEEVGRLVDDDTLPHLRAEWLAGYGAAHYLSGDRAQAIRLLEEAVSIYRSLDEQEADPDVLVDFPRALNNLGLVLMYSGRAGERNEVYTELQEEMLELAQRLADEVAEALALANLAHHRDPGGDPAHARDLFVQAEEAGRKVGSDRLAGLADQRAYFEFSQGELDEAARQWEKSTRLAEEIGDVGSALRSRMSLAACQVEQGDLDAADRFGKAVADVLADPEMSTGMLNHPVLLVFGAGVDAALGRLEQVAMAAGASEKLEQRDLIVRWDLVDYFQRTVEKACRGLGESAFEAARSRGAVLDDDDLTAFLLESRSSA